jgi:hypothetical protein
VLEDRTVPSTITVNTTADANTRDNYLTLREAILLVNGTLAVSDLTPAEQAQVSGTPATPGVSDTITFNIPWNDPGHVYYQSFVDNAHVQTVPSVASSDTDLMVTAAPKWQHSWWLIQPTTALPAINAPVVIDGYTQGQGTPQDIPDRVLRIQLDGSVRAQHNDFGSQLLFTAGNSAVRGLDITSYNRGVAIELQTNGGNRVQGNFLGTDISGTFSTNPVVDFTSLSGGAVGRGVLVDNGSGHNTIGTDVNGSNDPADGNLISGNSRGVTLFGGNPASDGYNVVAGNFVGTDMSGTFAIPNWGGVNTGFSHDDAIEDNLISGNRYGVLFAYTTGTINTSFPPAEADGLVTGNLIGTDRTGTAGLTGSVHSALGLSQDFTGNYNAGVVVTNAAQGITIGGPDAALANTIAYSSGGPGVWIAGRQNQQPYGNPTGIRVEGNSIRYNTGGLGIDLGATPTVNADGITINGSHTGVGPNNWQPFPLLTAAQSGSSVLISGTLNSAVDTQYTVDVYANDPTTLHSSLLYQGQYYGEGQYYVGSTTVTTDDSGNRTFAAAFSAANLPGGALPAGWYISATATDFGGNTSEFGPDVQASTSNALQQALTSGATVTVQAATTAEVNTVLLAVSKLDSNTLGTLFLNLSGFTKYGSQTVSAPAGLTVIVNGNPVSQVPTTVDPAVAALVVTSGKVIVTNVTFTESGDAPTILVTGGSLALRNDVIQESTGFNDAAISVTGGTLDLGTGTDPGGNTININGTGTFIRNTTADPISSVGDAFEIDGQGVPWPVPLTVTTSSSLVLAGNSPPPLTGFVNGIPFVGTVTYPTAFGDTVTLTLNTAATSASPVGQYAITASLSGADADNYVIDPTTSTVGTMYVVSVGPDPDGSGAQAVSFWDNKGNAKLITAADLSSLDALNLVTQGGSAFDPRSVAQLEAWLSVSPNATAAYQLAVQLAVMDLNVLAGYVQATDLVYAVGLLPNATADNIAGLTSGGFIDVQDLMQAANAALALVNPGNPSSDPNAAYELALAQALQAANGNSDFVTQELIWGLLGL